MTKVTEEAGVFLHGLLLARNTPTFVKDGLRARLAAPSVREAMLRSRIAIVQDSSQTQAARLAALQQVIDVFKGDL